MQTIEILWIQIRRCFLKRMKCIAPENEQQNDGERGGFRSKLYLGYLC